MKNIRKIRSKTYKQIIEVLVPIRFYWDSDGFDGIEIGKLHRPTRHELRLIDKIINQVCFNMKLERFDCDNCQRLTPIPDIYYEAFKEK